MPLNGLARPLLRAAVRAAALAEPLYGGRVRLDGHQLDPEVHAALAAARAVGIKRLEEMSVEEARAYAARALGAFDAAPAPMACILETAAPGPAGPIPVHVYQPWGAQPAMIVYLHGGGGVIGSVASYDAACRLIAARTGAAVASVEYRLAPEHPHPAAIDDALAVWRWAHRRARSLGVEPGRIGVAGDSFGGFLAAWVERRARAAGLPAPAVMGLVYPALDLTLSAASHATFADGFVLTAALMRWFLDHLVPPDQRRAASPLFVDDLAGAAPAVIVTAGFDPLRDDGRAYAERLRAAGGRVDYVCEADLIHGFLGMTGAFRRADAAATRLCEALRAELLR